MKIKHSFLTCILILAVVLFTGCSAVTHEVAKDGDTVYVHYTGTLSDGSVFDSSVGGDPLVFVLGEGKMITGFENAVRGMKVGETKTITLSPAEAYGEYREDLVTVFPKSEIPEDITVEIGMVLSLQSSSGDIFYATVIAIGEDTITLDANYELAGKELTFEIELVKIE